MHTTKRLSYYILYKIENYRFSVHVHVHDRSVLAWTSVQSILTDPQLCQYLRKVCFKSLLRVMTIDFPLNMHWPKAYIGSHHFRYIHRRYNFKIVWITFSTNSKPMQLYPLKNLNILTRTKHYRLGRKKGVCNGTESTKNKINLDQEVILLFKCTCIYYMLSFDWA